MKGIIDYSNEHFACVYCLGFPDGKKYVGKTADIGSMVKKYEKSAISCDDGYSGKKVSSAIRFYGMGSVGIQILSKISGIGGEDLEVCLSILEIKHIREQDCVYPKGYNVSLGGELLGIPIEYITTDAATIKSLKTSNKILLEYDIDGNFVAEYPSISRFAYEKGYDEDSVRLAVNKMHAFMGKHILRVKRYDYIPQKIETDSVKVIKRVKYRDIIKERIIERDRVVRRKSQPVICYNSSGDFVGEYASITEAVNTVFGGHGKIRLGKYTRNYIFFAKSDDNYPRKIETKEELLCKVKEKVYRPADQLEDAINPYEWGGTKHEGCIHSKLKNDFTIRQYKLNGDFVAEYNNIRDASRITGIAYSSIYACIIGKVKKGKGFIWRKAD